MQITRVVQSPLPILRPNVPFLRETCSFCLKYTEVMRHDKNGAKNDPTYLVKRASFVQFSFPIVLLVDSENCKFQKKHQLVNRSCCNCRESVFNRKKNVFNSSRSTLICVRLQSHQRLDFTMKNSDLTIFDQLTWQYIYFLQRDLNKTTHLSVSSLLCVLSDIGLSNLSL